MCNHKVPALLPFNTVKGLSDNVGFKEDGTMEVGAGMEVHGDMTLNSPTDLKFKQGSLPKPYNWHFVKLVAGPHPAVGYKFTTSFLMPATSDLKVANLNDLFTVFSGDYIACSGTVTYGGGTGNLLGIHFGDNSNNTKVIVDGGENGIVELNFHSTYGIASVSDNVFQPK